eukprot:TRINITY_DN5447_c0_g1_i1.p1 TRINITY_DN5447_c0_g1~~TRINITY_DN5447_c0_g1_i1.p1  ORF type:complete len:449 (+),score=90.97 TRINITY_DN5447_c0_g1_i1:21-1367(+)
MSTPQLIAYVQHDYQAESDEQISFTVGAKIIIVEPETGGWALGRLEDGTEGWFPFNYVELQAQSKQSKRSSTILSPTSTNQEELVIPKAVSLKNSHFTIPSQESLSFKLQNPGPPKPKKPERSISVINSKIPDKFWEKEGFDEKTLTPPTLRDNSPKSLLKKNTEKSNTNPTPTPISSPPPLTLTPPAEAPSSESPPVQVNGPNVKPLQKNIFTKFVSSFRNPLSPRGAARDNGVVPSPRSRVEDETNIFGLSIEALVNGNDVLIPIIVEQCITHLETHAMMQEGIFRLSGSKIEIEEMKRKYKTPTDRLDYSKVSDPNSVAVLLKQFFTQLKEPLFTFEMYDEFSDLMENTPSDYKLIENVPVDPLKNLLHRLPDANLQTAKFLLKFLKKLSLNREQTKMATSNLALVFGPNLLRSKESTGDGGFVGGGSKLVEICLLHYDHLFDQS